MRFFNPFTTILILAIVAVMSACTEHEDPGPVQYIEQPFAITDFDRLDIGDAMNVTVTKGNVFSISVKGDRRNIDDLEFNKVGNTLVTRFTNNRNRKHTTYITVTMPSIISANFYGATTASIDGFEEDNFTLNLSGASFAQVDIAAEISNVNLSGASSLTISGSTNGIITDLSGASLLKAYNMMAKDMNVTASGASHAYVHANKTLTAEATGASSIMYRGDATVSSKTSGASSILKD